MTEFFSFIKEISWVLSIILGVAAIIQTWRIRRKTKKDTPKRKLILYYKNSLQVDLAKIPYDIEFNYKDKVYKNLYLFEMIFGNNGNVIITKDDLAADLKIEFDKPVKILSLDSIDKTRDDLNYTLNKTSVVTTDHIDIGFYNIDVKDAIKFKILVTASDTPNPLLKCKFKNEVSKEVVKTKDVTDLSNQVKRSIERDPYPPSPPGIGGMLFLLGLIVVPPFIIFNELLPYLIDYFIKNWKFTIYSSEIVAFITCLLLSILFVTVFLLIMIRVIREWKNFDPKMELDKRLKEAQNYSETDFGPGFNLDKIN